MDGDLAVITSARRASLKRRTRFARETLDALKANPRRSHRRSARLEATDDEAVEAAADPADAAWTDAKPERAAFARDARARRLA